MLLNGAHLIFISCARTQRSIERGGRRTFPNDFIRLFIQNFRVSEKMLQIVHENDSSYFNSFKHPFAELRLKSIVLKSCKYRTRELWPPRSDCVVNRDRKYRDDYFVEKIDH